MMDKTGDLKWHQLVSQPEHKMIVERDVMVPMRDGVRIAVDVLRPDAPGEFPGLLAWSSLLGKEQQQLTIPKGKYDYEQFRWRKVAGIEAGDSEFWTSRGYVHVIAEPRGLGNSEGDFDWSKERLDMHDCIEWIAEQPWCNNNVGMIGMSAFGYSQLIAAATQPPHLKAICPVEAMTDRYRHGSYIGGILKYGFQVDFAYKTPLLVWPERPKLSPEQVEKVEELKKHPDVRGHAYLYSTLIEPRKNMFLFTAIMNPNDGPNYKMNSAYTYFERVKIPSYFMCRWDAGGHMPGAFQGYLGVDAPKKLRLYSCPKPLIGPSRPWGVDETGQHMEILRWYDHWLKGNDTGIMDEPPVQLFIQGKDEFRFENEWPLARTKWTKLYLRENGSLQETPPAGDEPPESFVNDPWPQLQDENGKMNPKEVPGIKYTTDPLSKPTEVTGPSALYFHAALSTEDDKAPLDANWTVDIIDIAPDGSENTVAKGWLKASHMEIDKEKSEAYMPYHPHNRSLPIEAGKVYEYPLSIQETSHVFKAGHRIQIAIRGQDDVRSFGQRHIVNMTETLHTVHHSAEHPSYWLAPVIEE